MTTDFWITNFKCLCTRDIIPCKKYCLNKNLNILTKIVFIISIILCIVDLKIGLIVFLFLFILILIVYINNMLNIKEKFDDFDSSNNNTTNTSNTTYTPIKHQSEFTTLHLDDDKKNCIEPLYRYNFTPVHSLTKPKHKYEYHNITTMHTPTKSIDNKMNVESASRFSAINIGRVEKQIRNGENLDSHIPTNIRGEFNVNKSLYTPLNEKKQYIDTKINSIKAQTGPPPPRDEMYRTSVNNTRDILINKYNKKMSKCLDEKRKLFYSRDHR